MRVDWICCKYVVSTRGSGHEQNPGSDHSFGCLLHTLDRSSFSVPVSSWEYRQAWNDSHKTRHKCVCLFFLSPACSDQFTFTFCSADLQFIIKRWLCLGVEPPAGPPKLLGEEHAVLSSRCHVSNIQLIIFLLQYTWVDRWQCKPVTLKESWWQTSLFSQLWIFLFSSFPVFSVQFQLPWKQNDCQTGVWHTVLCLVL